ncbi:PAC2 family protein [Brachybacterium sp. AOP25-B2-12]|uniref:PAC2 family protein n=1 Tax=Brachybacterium sp. AOP25-B2-12 TaxID=3457710 RepID=UPI004034342C
MLDPTTLFQYEKDVEPRSLTATTMVVTLEAFADAGHAQELIEEHLFDALPHRVIGRLDLDQVFDYGAHRPEITLEHDRFLDYARPEILLYEVTAPNERPFYLLTGPEPTLQWERIASAIRIVVEQLGVTRTVMAQSFPAPVPHTRPLTITTYADDPEHIQAPRPLPATFRMRSTFTYLLTLRLGQAGHETVGLVAHVPQYLHEMPYPEATIALLRGIETETGLPMPVGALAPAAQATREAVAEQVADAAQLQQLVRAFEENYDRALPAGPGDSTPGGPAETEVPSGDEIAAEVERFLQGLGDGTGDTEDGQDHQAS